MLPEEEVLRVDPGDVRPPRNAVRMGVPDDAFKAERDQGITIDTTQIWFKSRKRDYVLSAGPPRVPAQHDHRRLGGGQSPLPCC